MFYLNSKAMEHLSANTSTRKKEYYRVIDGRRYDAALLAQVDTYLSNSSGNTLSEAEVRALGEAVKDANRITAVEKATLEYIRSNFPMNAKAIAWWDKNIQILNNLAQRIYKIKENNGIPGIQVEFDDAERLRQTNFPDNKIAFEEALAKALPALLSDKSTGETPYNLVSEIFGSSLPKAPDQKSQLMQKVREFANTGRIGLIPQYDPEDMESWNALPYPVPEDRELVEDNWIFASSFPDLSDHIYWVIVDRSGKKETYVYGFN